MSTPIYLSLSPSTSWSIRSGYPWTYSLHIVTAQCSPFIFVYLCLSPLISWSIQLGSLGPILGTSPLSNTLHLSKIISFNFVEYSIKVSLDLSYAHCYCPILSGSISFYSFDFMECLIKVSLDLFCAHHQCPMLSIYLSLSPLIYGVFDQGVI